MKSVQKLDVLPIVRPSATDDNAPTGEKDLRWAGSLFMAIGLLLLALAAGDTLPGTTLGSGGREDTLRGTEEGELRSGFEGRDEIYGLTGNDVLSGGDGEDELYGGPGRDMLLGGAGDDFIEAKDGWLDYVDCGPGKDVASVDVGDRVTPSCETVYPG